MQPVFHARRSIALFCLAVLLIGALIPAASGLPVGILVPLWIFVAAIVTSRSAARRTIAALSSFPGSRF